MFTTDVHNLCIREERKKLKEKAVRRRSGVWEVEKNA